MTRRIAAMMVHVYTASGIFPAAAAVVELSGDDPDPRWVFVYLLLTTFIDATDGPLARWLDVKRNAPSIDGRTIDDILDYLTFALIPLWMCQRLGWLAEGWGWLWAVAALSSLLGFANVNAKDESGGFFRGFPSYWNVFAFYAGLSNYLFGPWPGTITMVLLAIAVVSPIWLIYPNLCPKPWKTPILIGAALWAIAMLAMLPDYPEIPGVYVGLSLLYPIFYVAVSWIVWRARTSQV